LSNKGADGIMRPPAIMPPEEDILPDMLRADEPEIKCNEYVKAIAKELLEKLAPYVENSIYIFIDVESIQFESAVRILNKYILPCNNQLPIPVRTSDGRTVSFKTGIPEVGYGPELGLEGLSSGEENIVIDVRIAVNGEMEKSDLDEIITSETPTLIFTNKSLAYRPFTGVVFENLLYKATKSALQRLAKTASSTGELYKMIKNVGRVPYDILLLEPYRIDDVKKIWSPPPPYPGSRLEKEVEGLEDIVISKSLRTYLNIAISILRAEGHGSLLLIGPPKSGRKTIAYAIAKKLNLPSYFVMLAAMMSKWVGESEKNLRTFFMEMRSRGGLAVFDGVDSLFSSHTMSDSSSNMKNILLSEMARQDNNFIVVFTSGPRPSGEMLSLPVLGRIKLIVPPPNEKMREQLIDKFVERIYNKHPLKDIALKKIREISSVTKKMTHASIMKSIGKTLKTSVKRFAGLYPGEIYDIIHSYITITLDAMITKKKLSPGIDPTMLINIDYTNRKLMLERLRDKARALGLHDIKNDIETVINEISQISY